MAELQRPEQWRERSRTCLRAAKLLLDSQLNRDSISRSYYAAYGAATGELIRCHVSFAHGWNNPSHEQLPSLISQNTPLSSPTKRRAVRLLRFLKQAREDADYRPWSFADQALALNCVHSATEVLQLLGVIND